MFSSKFVSFVKGLKSFKVPSWVRLLNYLTHISYRHIKPQVFKNIQILSLHILLCSYSSKRIFQKAVKLLYTKLMSHRKSFLYHLLVLLSMIIEVMSILMDIIILAIYYPSGELWSSTEKFSAVMAIFNLTLR